MELAKNAITPKEAIHVIVRVVSNSYQIILVKVDYDTLGCVKIFVLIYAFKSSDIDECSIRSIRKTCGANKHCVNTLGSYTCKCNRGYKQKRNGTCKGSYLFGVATLAMCKMNVNLAP